jgi:hypothetical protein
MSGTVQELAAAIQEIVASEGQIRGSHLAQAVRNRFPGWRPTDSGTRNLRDFVVSQVPGVCELGRSGMDVIYGPSGAEPPVQIAPPPPGSPTDLWRVWVSPNSPLVLAVDRAAGTAQAVPRRSPAEPTQCLLEPPSATEHRKIAQEFLSRVPAPLQEQLSTIVESATATWWQAWLNRLRGTEHLAPWNEFRRARLESSLRQRLAEASIAADTADNIVKLVRESHAAAPTRGEWRLARTVIPEDESGQSIRRVVALAVQRMSTAELRELRLPLGIVLDVLASKSR